MQPDVSRLGRVLDFCETRLRLPAPLVHVLLVGLVLALTFTGYLTVLKWRGPAATVVTWTPWDEFIPFAPGWVWVYMLPYALGPLVAAGMRRPAIEWFATRATVVALLSLTFFALLPTRTVRPPFAAEATLTMSLYGNMIAADEPPANAAPSLHVSFTCLMMLALIYDRPRLWPLALAATVLVALSTLLTWQHHLIDVTSGAALALLVGLWKRRPTNHASPTP